MSPAAKAKKIYYFQDLATSLQFGNVKADQRVQIKIPHKVVAEIDKQFPNIDRSHFFTQLAVEAINQKFRYQERKILRDLAKNEQEGLDTMLSYLEERDDTTSTNSQSSKR